MLFCPSCGTLLALPGDDDEISCEQCGRKEPASCTSTASAVQLSTLIWLAAYENLDTKTYSHPQAFPSVLRQKRALVQSKAEDGSRQKGKDPVVSFWQDRRHPPRRLTVHLSLAVARQVRKVRSYRSFLQGDAAAVGRRGQHHLLQGERVRFASLWSSAADGTSPAQCLNCGHQTSTNN